MKVFLLNLWTRFLKLFGPSKEVVEGRERVKLELAKLENSREMIIAKIELSIADKVRICNEIRLRDQSPETEATVRRWEKRILFDQERLRAMRESKKSWEINVHRYLSTVFMTSDAIQPPEKKGE